MPSEIYLIALHRIDAATQNTVKKIQSLKKYKDIAVYEFNATQTGTGCLQELLDFIFFQKNIKDKIGPKTTLTIYMDFNFSLSGKNALTAVPFSRLLYDELKLSPSENALEESRIKLLLAGAGGEDLQSEMTLELEIARNIDEKRVVEKTHPFIIKNGSIKSQDKAAAILKCRHHIDMIHAEKQKIAKSRKEQEEKLQEEVRQRQEEKLQEEQKQHEEKKPQIAIPLATGLPGSVNAIEIKSPSSAFSDSSSFFLSSPKQMSSPTIGASVASMETPPPLIAASKASPESSPQRLFTKVPATLTDKNPSMKVKNKNKKDDKDEDPVKCKCVIQ